MARRDRDAGEGGRGTAPAMGGGRTFGWFGRYRWLSKDYERLPESSETMVRLAMLQAMLKRLELSTQALKHGGEVR